MRACTDGYTQKETRVVRAFVEIAEASHCCSSSGCLRVCYTSVTHAAHFPPAVVGARHGCSASQRPSTILIFLLKARHNYVFHTFTVFELIGPRRTLTTLKRKAPLWAKMMILSPEAANR